MSEKIWKILSKKSRDILDILLENRSLKTKKEKEIFFSPIEPKKITLRELSISKLEVSKAIKRLEKAKKEKEKVIIYGDYDADGITASAIMWEALHKFGVDVTPYIPDRFSEGYGINFNSVAKLKENDENLKLIITVDNGIVANKEIQKINKLGIDVIITDHHTPQKTKPNAFAIIHTREISGSAVSWIFAREIGFTEGLELAAIGTIADQMPLIGSNRSFAKYGIEKLNKTNRLGILELLKESGVKSGNIGTYEINYIIAPRINSMGRLAHGIDSLRLLCTPNRLRAKELAKLVAKTNNQRQKIVDKTVVNVRKRATKINDGIIFIADSSYHEGIIGLAAGKLVEEFYRPAIVVSVGEKLSKGSARSVSGFNIIKEIRKHEDLLIAHGGHIMAAGFTIESSKISIFQKRLITSSKKLLTDEILSRKLKIDTELKFENINWQFVSKLKKFEPTGNGNPKPMFVTYNCEIEDKKLLGKEKKHLKLKLKQGKNYFDAIGFNMSEIYKDIEKESKIDIVYSVEENVWNGIKSLQLNLRDAKIYPQKKL